MAKWIEFRETLTPLSNKTKRWEVISLRDGAILGRISWWNAWRKYVFSPSYPTVWEEDCLHDVAEFIESHTKEYKTSKMSAL